MGHEGTLFLGNGGRVTCGLLDCPRPEAAGEMLRERLPIIGTIEHTVNEQERKYGPFEPTVAGVRLAVAVLEDETLEVLDAWRKERRLLQLPPLSRGQLNEEAWKKVRTETIQVAAVALRLVRAIDEEEK